jgi:hypothetical protein
MSDQAHQTSKNQDSIPTAELDQNKIIDVPKNDKTTKTPEENWTTFLNDFKKSRFSWVTKVQVLDEDIDTSLKS